MVYLGNEGRVLREARLSGLGGGEQVDEDVRLGSWGSR